MPDFPPELVAETRARIQNELQAKRNQIERNIEELDAAQQTSRQQAIQRSARLGGQAKASRREDAKFPPPSRFGQFPSDVVEQTRARVRSESRIQREAIEDDIEELDAAQQPSRQQAIERRTRLGGKARASHKKDARVQYQTQARLLEEEHEEITVASGAFPLTITPSILRTCTKEYYQILETGSKRDLCASCGTLFEENSLCQVGTDEPHISATLSPLDSCGIKESSVSLCTECDMSLRRNKVPKFSASNHINTTLCQEYPPELEGLTYIEECVIALAHPIGAIIKLTSGGRSAGIEYRGSRGHFITFKQDPSQLLTILPSSPLDLYKHVTISWAGMSKPTPENLMAFCRIEKARVLRALVWLVQNNVLYRNITIDYELIESWEARFVPEVLIETAIITEDNWHLDQREGYITSLEGGSYENDFDALHEEVDPGTVIGGSFLADEEGQNQNKQMAFIAKLTELVRDHEDEASMRDPHIEFSSTHPESDMVPKSSYQDSDFFTASFPTLFPRGTGGHKDPRRTEDVSLQAWARWTLKHHSRRFAKHPTFLFLLYDVIFLRQSSLGNFLQVKKGYWEAVKHDFSTLTSVELQQAATDLQSGRPCSNAKIQQLMRDVRLISSYTPESFGRKLAMRHLLWGSIVRFGMPAIWFTLNPADLSSPLIMNLSGILDIPVPHSASDTIRRTAVANPVVVAEFFHLTMKAFFTAFLRTRTGECGILGEVSHYAGVVETNGRGMLHQHGFIWLTGNLDFPMLRQKLLSNPEFKSRVVEYLQSIINESVDEDAARAYSSQHPNETLRTDISGQSDKDWAECMKNHGNFVAYNKNMHSHTSSCYKYGYKRVANSSKGTQGDHVEVDGQAGLGEEENSGGGQGQ